MYWPITKVFWTQTLFVIKTFSSRLFYSRTIFTLGLTYELHWHFRYFAIRGYRYKVYWTLAWESLTSYRILLLGEFQKGSYINCIQCSTLIIMYSSGKCDCVKVARFPHECMLSLVVTGQHLARHSRVLACSVDNTICAFYEMYSSIYFLFVEEIYIRTCTNWMNLVQFKL